MAFHVLSKDIQKLLKERGFDRPTTIQKMGIPEILDGRDVLIIGSTGSGKTETVMLPVFDMVRGKKPISAIYITPLKSLNRDLLDRLVWWGEKLGIEIAVRHGDTTSQERKQQMAFPPHILITTPETLTGSIISDKMRELLRNVKIVVIDEIHEIVQSKRGASLSLLIERIEKLSGKIQRIGISATVGSEKKVARFLSKDAKIVKSREIKKKEISVVCPAIDEKTREIADQLNVMDETAARIVHIMDIARKHESVIVFTNTRETAEILSSRISKLDPDFKQRVHHGSLSKEIRIEAEKTFKDRKTKMIIATSSLELGIDIGSVDLVIQYLSPRQVAKFVQRLGRSGHRFDKTSKAIILSSGEDLLESYAIAELAMKEKYEELLVHEKALDILALHIVGMSMEYREVEEDLVFETVKKAYPYRNLKREEFDELLAFLSKHRLVFRTDGKIKRSRRGLEFYFSNLSPIPDSRVFRVVDVSSRKSVGTLDEEFVAEHCDPGNSFFMGGNAWKVVNVENGIVYATPSSERETAVPSWEGELIPVSYEVASRVASIREKRDWNRELLGGESEKEMVKYLDSQKPYPMPSSSLILVEQWQDYIIVHSPFGSRVNDTIGRYLSEGLIEKYGSTVQLKSDPYRIILKTIGKMDDVVELLRNVEKFEDRIRESLINSSLFKWRFIHNAIRMGVIDRKADYRKISLQKVIGLYRFTPIYDETIREIMLEKLDLRNSKRVLKAIKEGEIRIETAKGLSYIGEQGLVAKFGELVRPEKPRMEIMRLFKRRLLSTKLIYYCVSCKQFTISTTVRDAVLECPKCHSRLIGVSNNRKTYLDAWKKYIKGKELDKSEKKVVDNIIRSSDLVLAYGKSALLALAARGIGVETAARILRRLHSSEEELIKDLMEEEKKFIQNKQFWK